MFWGVAVPHTRAFWACPREAIPAWKQQRLSAALWENIQIHHLHPHPREGRQEGTKFQGPGGNAWWGSAELPGASEEAARDSLLSQGA